MSRENVAAVRRMVERWNAGDVEGWLECWSAEAEWTSQPIGAFEGGPRTYRGHEGLRRFVADVLEGFADLGEFLEPSFRDVGGSVLVLADYRAQAGATGPEASARWGWLFELRDGEVVRGRDFLDQQQALETANVEFVHRAIDAFNRQDLAALADFCTEDFEFVSMLTAVEAGGSTYRGPDAWGEYFARMREAWSQWWVDDFEVFDAGDDSLAAVVRVAGRGHNSGVAVERTIGMTYRLHEGRIRRMRAYLEPEEALAAVGLSE